MNRQFDPKDLALSEDEHREVLLSDTGWRGYGETVARTQLLKVVEVLERWIAAPGSSLHFDGDVIEALREVAKKDERQETARRRR